MNLSVKEAGTGLALADEGLPQAQIQVESGRPNRRGMRGRRLGYIAAIASAATLAACGGSEHRMTSSSAASGSKVHSTGPNSVNTVAVTKTVTAKNSSPKNTSGKPEEVMCTNKHLRIGFGQGTGAAGSEYLMLTFTNTGRAACWLYGYPGVSARNVRHHRIGEAAVRDRSVRPHKVILRPEYAATATLQIGNAANYPPAKCEPEQAIDLRVYPPGSFGHHAVPHEFTACAAGDVALMHIRPVAQ